MSTRFLPFRILTGGNRNDCADIQVDLSRCIAARCKRAEIPLDTDLAGNTSAFNPAELLLAALSACMIKGIERVIPFLNFTFRGVEVRVDGVRQDVPSNMESIGYENRVACKYHYDGHSFQER